MIVDSKRKIVIMQSRKLEGDFVLDVYENDGQFVRSFGEGLSTSATDLDLVLASDDHVIVLDEGCYVHMFSEHGDHLSKFKVSTYRLFMRTIAFHHSSKHVVFAHASLDYVYLQRYTKDGELA